jgi:hypothetical protein
MFQMGGHKPPPPKPSTARAKPQRAPKRSPVTVHLDATEKARFEELGGEDWLRQQLRSPDAAED